MSGTNSTDKKGGKDVIYHHISKACIFSISVIFNLNLFFLIFAQEIYLHHPESRPFPINLGSFKDYITPTKDHKTIKSHVGKSKWGSTNFLLNKILWTISFFLDSHYGI